MSDKFKVLFSSLKMASATMLSRIFGLIREQVLASIFGASGLTDAFLIAYRIPNMLRDLFAEGAFSSAFVPTFMEAKSERESEAKKLLWALFILLGSLTLLIGLGIYIFAPEILMLFAPSFKDDPEKFQLTVDLIRMMSPFLFFISIAALFMGVLNSLKVFFLPSVAPVFFNISMILSMLLLPTWLLSQGYHPIYSLGVGVFIGGFFQAFIQFPFLLKKGFAPIRPGKLFTQYSKKVFILLGPGLLGFAATQINLIVTTILASSVGEGAVSWLSFAFRLFQLPVGILGVSIGNSNLVHFSSSWKQGDRKRALDFLFSSYFLSLVTVLPAMLILLLFSSEIIQLIFEHGKFDQFATIMTSKALVLYAIGLPFYGIYKIFVPTFYTLGLQKIPVYTSIVSIGLNIAFCVIFTPVYGFEVLALGTTLSMFFNTTVQLFFIRKHLEVSLSEFFNIKLFKFLGVSIAVAGIVFSLKMRIPMVYRDLIFWQQIVYLAIGMTFLTVLYFGFLFFLGEKKTLKR